MPSSSAVLVMGAVVLFLFPTRVALVGSAGLEALLALLAADIQSPSIRIMG